MYESFAITFVTALKVYATLGALFAIGFVTYGVGRLDRNAQGAGFGFRVLMFPGTVAIWPLLLSRWAKGVHEPPLEGNPHQ